MSLFNNFLSLMSKGKVDVKKEFELIGNCFGFFGLDGGVGTSTLCFEIAQLASEKNLHVCLVDCSPLSTFYLTKMLASIKFNGEVPSINRRFIKRTCPLADCLISANDYLKIMSFGDMALTETFDMSFDIILETYKELKDSFDLVIMDIPNLPWCETVIAALQECSTVYTLCGPSTDCILKKSKLDGLFSIIEIDRKLNNLIINMVPKDISLSTTISENTNGVVLAECPYVPTMRKAALTSTSVLGSIKGSEAHAYGKVVDFIMSEILEGISGKHNDEGGVE